MTFTSDTNPRTSPITYVRSFKGILVICSISLVHALVSVRVCTEMIKQAAAISDARCFSIVESSKHISCMYCAKKNTRSVLTFDGSNFLNLYRNRYAVGPAILNCNTVSRSSSNYSTSDLWNLPSATCKRSRRSGG